MSAPRSILLLKHRKFLNQALDFSWYLYDQVKIKLNFFYGAKCEVSSVLLLAEVLLKSEWGDHPLAQKNYPYKSTKDANNLTLLERDSSWAGKVLKYNGNEYKSFESWEEFACHWTDILVFRKNLNPYLIHNLYTTPYDSKVELIEKYDLREFEIGGEEDS